MKSIKDSLKLFRFNIRRVICFEIILMIVSTAILVPGGYLFLNFAIRANGDTYLSRENVSSFLSAPTTWIALLIVLLILSFFLLINYSGISICYDWANHTEKIGLIRMLALSVRHGLRVFVPHNLPMFIFIICFMPLTGAIVVGLLLLNFKLPVYIAGALAVNLKVTIPILAGYLLLNLINFVFIFALHTFVIRKIHFFKAMAEAFRIVKGKMLRVIPGLFLVNVVILGGSYGLHFLLTGPLLHWILKIKGAGFVAGFVFESVNVVLFFIYLIIGIPVLYSFICNSYYNNVPDESGSSSIDDYEEVDGKTNRKRRLSIVLSITMLAIIIDVTFYILITSNVISLHADYMNKVTITAHRGASKKAPENSLSAFEVAIEDGADVVELDVRQTKDGVVVVMHDENLKRTCGVNKKVGNLTYEELQGIYIDAGHKDKYPNEKIPTLREAIELVDGRAEMNIEIKSASTDTDLEESVAEIVREYDLFDSCVVTSPTYESIRKVKRYDDRIKTVYVMSVAMGDFYDLKYADAFSLKYRYVTSEVVDKVHRHGKEIYAWVVDDDKTLERMMLLNVDSIITNKPGHMKKNMYKNIYGDSLFEYLNMYLESSY
ncbi:MAG: glycerophosphoryl diester phosphodiesterase membrane domain-containing protein [Eubacterium sp.]|nr:glycerophosphoryl diester phosphodiesterase membrane domain-containing protein [Eubacterium sp.]